VVSQAEAMVSEGALEITLLGQNVNSYGRDLYGTPRFAALLKSVADTGVSRLGFATSHPKDLCDETIDVISSNENILDYIHLPFQSGSTDILKAMNRHYTKEQYLALVKRIRQAMPDIALSTDIIVGFPGETERDFADTLDVVRQAGFSSAFTFIYSPREGTPASMMQNQVPTDVTQQRFTRLLDEVQRQAYAYSQSLVGTCASVLIESTSKRDTSVLTGRDRHYKTVHIALPPQSSADAWVGREVKVMVSEAHTWYVVGELRT
jgi:tRNA-2-methylthio-N6-dimethylallyladenosine synthase